MGLFFSLKVYAIFHWNRDLVNKGWFHATRDWSLIFMTNQTSEKNNNNFKSEISIENTLFASKQITDDTGNCAVLEPRESINRGSARRLQSVGSMSNDQTDTIELESGSRIQVASAMDSGDEGHLSPTTHSHSNSVYETRYQKSLRHYLTREALPKESHYRNLNSIVDGGNVRPTLDDLHNNTFREQQVRDPFKVFFSVKFVKKHLNFSFDPSVQSR